MSQYAEHLAEVFIEFGPVAVRRMFGGHGVFRDGVMFALVADGVLYLKADAVNVVDFEHRGLAAFEYTRAGKPVALSYYVAPEEIMEDPETAARWARRSFEAALRARKPGPGRPAHD